MKILLVSVASPPKITGAECLQVGKFIKYLASANSLSLLTTVAAENDWYKKDEKHNGLLKDVRQTISLQTIPAFGKYSGFILRKLLKNQFSKPDEDFLFHLQSKKAVRLLKETPDLIYSRSSPLSSAVMALKIKRLLKKPWVMHLSDPLADSIYNEENLYRANAEKECFEAADKISFTTEETKDFYIKKYPHFMEKFFVCPNVYEESEVNPDENLFTGEKVKLLYSGALYGKRTIEPIIKSLKSLSREKQDLLDVRLIGVLDEKDLNLINSSGLDCVKFDGFVLPDESYDRQREADILLSIEHPVENEIDKVYLPSKIQDYMAARKFILAITGKNSATYKVVQNKYGACFEHHEQDLLLKFWNDLTDAFSEKNYEFLKIKPLDKTFEAKSNAEKLLEVFESLVKTETQT